MRTPGRAPSAHARLWWLWAAVTVVATAAAFVVGHHVRSPWADAQANAQASVDATATIAQGTIDRPVPSFTATVSLGTTIELLTSSAPDTSRQVVTAQRARAGTVVTSGDVLIEVSGRPVFALTLAFPLYRDLHGGDSGPDVQALQGSLADLGLYRGAQDGILGPATQDAVTRLYTTRETRTPATPDERQADREAAERALQELAADPDASAPDIAAAHARADSAARAAGSWLPVSEVLAIPGAQATVASAAPVGTVLDGASSALTLRVGEATATGRVGVADADAFTVGSPTLATLVGGEVAVTGHVADRTEFLPEEGESLPGYDVTVALDGPGELGDDARVTVSPAGGGGSETGLVVPLAAVREDAEGTYVLVATGGRPARVTVSPGVSAHGEVIVTGDLREGDQVVVASSS